MEKNLKGARILPLTRQCANGMRGRGVRSNRKKTAEIKAMVVIVGCTLVAQAAHANKAIKDSPGAEVHRARGHHVVHAAHPMTVPSSHEHRRPAHSQHIGRAKHEERVQHNRVVTAHSGGRKYTHRVRIQKHSVHHGSWAPREVYHAQRAPVVQEPWADQTPHAPTWVLPQVCNQVLNYTGACQPAVLESLRVLGVQAPKVEDRGQMAQHLQSILDHDGLEQVQAQCQSVLAEDQRKISGLQTLLARAHVVPPDDCSREIQNLAAQQLTVQITAVQAQPASVATGASDVAQAPVAASEIQNAQP